ncbi:DUF1492 domain-containing protein (plasmid) [Fructilactobacillus ixorae]|uniref:DUF1492 domain-containing protein n=1 Tax=Fructilactobacillus ixorae TaxID=1750535 RepID=A0ABY5C7A6_9LACO|nr:ArpU family phage packaging/lysis transcriptional regulator [Fructilactobacillus ixorae]USS93990.1 DUF1492 domain-containing protein [Fructilactobacillus ixorae]
MKLFDDVDEKRTLYRTKKFLTVTFPKIRMQSGLSSIDLQSPTISDMPSSAPYGNSNERKWLRMLERQDEVKDVIRAINSTSSISKFILRSCYLDGLSNWQVSQRLNFGNTRFAELKNKALLEFATAIEVYGVNLIEFRV